MSTPHKRSATEAWKAICEMTDEEAQRAEDEAADREAERILALSPEEVRRELIEGGFDPDEVRARADRLMEELLGPSEPAPLPSGAAPPGGGENQTATLSAAISPVAAAAVATPAVATGASAMPAAKTPTPPEPSSLPGTDLDEVAKLDRPGDADSTVRADRAAAKAAREDESRPTEPKK